MMNTRGLAGQMVGGKSKLPAEARSFLVPAVPAVPILWTPGHKLKIQSGRLTGDDRRDRLCSCTNDIQTIEHVLFNSTDSTNTDSSNHDKLYFHPQKRETDTDRSPRMIHVAVSLESAR